MKPALWLLLALAGPARGEVVAPAPQAALEASVRAHVASLPPSRVKVMLEEALTHLGTRYFWGGDDAAVDGGFDCAGLVYSVFHASGLEFPLARFSTMNMTPAARGPNVPSVWWTAYVPDFGKDMVACAPPLQDGDVVVYHALAGGKVSDRTGHVVIVADAKKGHAISAASAGVRLHALGDFSRYDVRERTACWRAPSATKAPYVHPEIVWETDLKGGKGTRREPFVAKNPVSFTVSVKGALPGAARFSALGRVNSFIGAVHPKIEELAPEGGARRFRLTHDFKVEDLPVDPGERIGTPLRKMVLRFTDDAGLVVGEKNLYVRIDPYW